MSHSQHQHPLLFPSSSQSAPPAISSDQFLAQNAFLLHPSHPSSHHSFTHPMNFQHSPMTDFGFPLSEYSQMLSTEAPTGATTPATDGAIVVPSRSQQQPQLHQPHLAIQIFPSPPTEGAGGRSGKSANSKKGKFGPWTHRREIWGIIGIPIHFC
ncbi:hypothetical protein niasHT_021506 [Heterodera trifolii]|uniref:Uncharacterized protein n=1 Tax=Heterodera trifolii TaxID=157864 RepID=A0ABD2KEL4_9BILA